MPTAQQAVTEVSVDSGKVRLRGNKGQTSYLRDYKAVRLGAKPSCCSRVDLGWL